MPDGERTTYEQTHDGLKLTAVEYIVLAADWKGSEPPSLFGHSFMLVPAPNRYGLPDFYALHAWLWRTTREVSSCLGTCGCDAPVNT